MNQKDSNKLTRAKADLDYWQQAVKNCYSPYNYKKFLKARHKHSLLQIELNKKYKPGTQTSLQLAINNEQARQ